MISPREVKFYNFNFVVNIIAITLIFPTLSECSDAQRTRRETIQYGGVHIDRREVGICETRYKYLHSMSETSTLIWYGAIHIWVLCILIRWRGEGSEGQMCFRSSGVGEVGEVFVRQTI